MCKDKDKRTNPGRKGGRRVFLKVLRVLRVLRVLILFHQNKRTNPGR